MMTPTLQEIDDVIDVLQWADDDICLGYLGGNAQEKFIIPGSLGRYLLDIKLANGLRVYPNLYERQTLRLLPAEMVELLFEYGLFKVLRPFLSKDGTLFRPEVQS